MKYNTKQEVIELFNAKFPNLSINTMTPFSELFIDKYVGGLTYIITDPLYTGEGARHSMHLKDNQMMYIEVWCRYPRPVGDVDQNRFFGNDLIEDTQNGIPYLKKTPIVYTINEDAWKSDSFTIPPYFTDHLKVQFENTKHELWLKGYIIQVHESVYKINP